MTFERGWRAPLPDLDHPAISQRLRIGERAFTVRVSPITQVADEPDTELVHVWTLFEDRLLTALDLGVKEPGCAHVWAYLTNRLTETVVDYYAPQRRPDQELNPRLGCWGIRPDLKAAGVEDDCGIAVLVGIATWTVGARPLGDAKGFLGALRDTVSESLAYWVLTASRAQNEKPPA